MLYFDQASQSAATNNYRHVIRSKFACHMLISKGYHVKTYTKLKNWFCADAIKNLTDKNAASSDESSGLVSACSTHFRLNVR